MDENNLPKSTPNINQQFSESSFNQNSKVNYWKIGFFIILLLLVFSMGLLVYFMKTNKSKELINQPESSPAVTITQIQPTNIPSDTTTSLPVLTLKTKYGIDGVPEPTYPPSVTTNIPQSLASQLSAYGASGYVIVGPKGWTGLGGVGADGNVSISLYPVNGSANEGPRVTVFVASTGTGSALFEAAPYSPWLQTHGKEIGLAPIPSLVPGLHLTPVTNYLSKYTLPNTPDGLAVNGIVFSDVQDHSKDSMWAFSKMEVVLPQSQQNLATVILDEFIARQGFLKEGQSQTQNSLKQADSQTPAAGICAEPPGDNVVMVTINEDTPSPRCLKALSNQRLKIKNNTSKTIEVTLAKFSTSLEPGKEYTFDSTFGTFLAPGVHFLSVSPYGGPEIWLQSTKN